MGCSGERTVTSSTAMKKNGRWSPSGEELKELLLGRATVGAIVYEFDLGSEAFLRGLEDGRADRFPGLVIGEVGTDDQGGLALRQRLHLSPSVAVEDSLAVVERVMMPPWALFSLAVIMHALAPVGPVGRGALMLHPSKAGGVTPAGVGGDRELVRPGRLVRRAGQPRRAAERPSGRALLRSPEHGGEFLAPRADREALGIANRRKLAAARLPSASTSRLTAILTAALTAALDLPVRSVSCRRR